MITTIKHPVMVGRESSVRLALESPERRHIYRVLTTDRRDFAAIRVRPRLTRALELLP